jgi:hypothetical protein
MSKAKFSLNINKREINFNVGVRFLRDYCKKNDCSIEDILLKIQENPFLYTPYIMYESVCAGNGGKVDFDEDTLIDWIDEDNGLFILKEFIQKITNYLTEDVPEEENDENVKNSKKK